MPALWISRVTVTDAENYARYAKLAVPAVEDHGGRFIARGGRVVQIEGEGTDRNTVIRFDTVEAAEACYRSAAYKAALEFANLASERTLTIVETSE
jgi:uncharacterized protein (DUF1330 family)